jgi:hypothetical protein
MDIQAIKQKVKTENPSMTAKMRVGGASLLPSAEDITSALGIDQVTIDWLAGDGSDRCYFRIKSPQNASTFVLMQLSKNDAKLIENNGYEWIQIGEILDQNGIFVPKTIATLPKFAAIIIEDYGDIMLENIAKKSLTRGDSSTLDSVYKKATEIVFNFFKIPQDPLSPWCKREFDFDRFSWELDFFYAEFLEKALCVPLSRIQKKQYREESKALSKYLASQDQVFVHRDFHSRNLMCKESCIAVIDFQDARLGPAAYDLVSLYFDSYVDLSDESRTKFICYAIDRLNQCGMTHLASQIESSWPATLLQRQLKALGSFAYLTIGKKRGDYLKYAPAATETLKIPEVFDERWPFLSKDLIGLISEKLDKR